MPLKLKITKTHKKWKTNKDLVESCLRRQVDALVLWWR